MQRNTHTSLSAQDMEEQYLLSEKDHHALNVKLEDFVIDFGDTIRRVFTCVRAASGRSACIRTVSHAFTDSHAH